MYITLFKFVVFFLTLPTLISYGISTYICILFYIRKQTYILMTLFEDIIGHSATNNNGKRGKYSSAFSIPILVKMMLSGFSKT